MKKLALLTVFLLFTKILTAQVNMGARMGMNMGMFDLKKDGEKFDVSPSLSVLINMDMDIPFSMYFSFRTGLGLVIKGSEIDTLHDMNKALPDTNYSLLYRLNYLEVPLFLVFRGETDFYGNFFLGVGPTLSLGVGGRMELFAESKKSGGQTQTTYNLVWGNKAAKNDLYGYNYIRRFDLGLGAIFAYQIPRHGLTFTVSYNKGLRNISPNKDKGIDLKTSYFGLSIGFTMAG